ncbi:hypothetical protein ZTR_09934 [Talaromyces verruculosus]|nr:hypothetical protein ZTR_09934 [Talaromyces verruculosus]
MKTQTYDLQPADLVSGPGTEERQVSHDVTMKTEMVGESGQNHGCYTGDNLDDSPDVESEYEEGDEKHEYGFESEPSEEDEENYAYEYNSGEEYDSCGHGAHRDNSHYEEPGNQREVNDYKLGEHRTIHESAAISPTIQAAKAPSDNTLIEKSLRIIGQKQSTPGTGWALSFVSRDIRDAIGDIQAILKERPIVTTRFIKYQLRHLTNDQIRFAIPYCGYRFDNGPWKRTIIRFGYDPRQNNASRVFQTLTINEDFRPVIDSRDAAFRQKMDKTLQEDGKLDALFPHIVPGPQNVPYMFDGTMFDTNDNVWQICDLSDLILSGIARTAELSDTLSWKNGWFFNGTMAKLSVIMADKLLRLSNNRTLLDYECLASIPDMYLARRLDCTGYGLKAGETYTNEQADLRLGILYQAISNSR